MPVLSRQIQEAAFGAGSAALARLLRATVIDANGTCVNLGFELDQENPIHRLELFERTVAVQAE